jgi:hypothetical protein
MVKITYTSGIVTLDGIDCFQISGQDELSFLAATPGIESIFYYDLQSILGLDGATWEGPNDPFLDSGDIRSLEWDEGPYSYTLRETFIRVDHRPPKADPYWKLDRPSNFRADETDWFLGMLTSDFRGFSGILEVYSAWKHGIQARPRAQQDLRTFESNLREVSGVFLNRHMAFGYDHIRDLDISPELSDILQTWDVLRSSTIFRDP